MISGTNKTPNGKPYSPKYHSTQIPPNSGGSSVTLTTNTPTPLPLTRQSPPDPTQFLHHKNKQTYLIPTTPTYHVSPIIEMTERYLATTTNNALTLPSNPYSLPL